MATTEQIETIRAQRVDDTACAMMRDGVTLTWEQADALGDDVLDWIERRLGLRVETTHAGVVYSVVAEAQDDA